MKKFFKKLWSELRIFIVGFVSCFLGFANTAIVITGFRAFLEVKATSGWFSVGYFILSLAAAAVYVFVSYVVGLFVKRKTK